LSPLGWTVGGGGNPTYQTFTTGDPDGVHGGLFATDGQLASYAVDPAQATHQRITAKSAMWRANALRPWGPPGRI
jgi:hypothetical protein